MIGEILFSTVATAQLRRFTTLVLLTLAQLIWANPGFAQTPGGVGTNLELWLKADTGGIAWTDQSGNAVAITQFGTVTAGTTMNFNPSNNISTAGGYDPTTALVTTDDLMLIAVFQDYAGHVVGLMPPAANDAEDPVLQAAASGAWRGFSDSLVENQVVTHSLSLTAGVPHIGALYSTNGSGSAELMLDGLRDTGTLTIAPGNRVGIGHDLASSGPSTGQGLVSEVIVYSTNASAAEKQRIESYLALKYGITLDQGTAQNYVDSAGATTFDATAAGAFTNDIAGIARDDATALDQRISRSANNGAILTVSTDTDFTAANTTHANTLTDGQYLVWGNEGTPADTVITGVVGGTLYEGLARTWRYQDTGAVGPINMQFDLTGLGLVFSGGSGPQLVLSTDPTIGNADDVLLPATTVVGDLITFQALDLADNTVAYFALLLQPAPVVSIVATDNAAAENLPDNGRFTVELSTTVTNANIAGGVTVTFTVGGTAAEGPDFATLPTSVMIPASADSATFDVTPLDDAEVEPTETVIVTLIGTDNAAVAVAAPPGDSATVTIADNDLDVRTGLGAVSPWWLVILGLALVGQLKRG